MENNNLEDHQQETGHNLISGPTDTIRNMDSRCEGRIDMQNAVLEKGCTASALDEGDGNSFSQSDKGSHEEGGANVPEVQAYENQNKNSGIMYERGVDIQTDIQTDKFNDDTASNSKEELVKNMSEENHYSHAVEVNNGTISVPGNHGNLNIIDVTQDKDFHETSKSPERIADINTGTTGTTTKVDESHDQSYNENDHEPRDAGEVRGNKENANSPQYQNVDTREENNAVYMDKEEALAKIRQGQTYDEEEDTETAEEVAIDYEAYDRAREKYVYFWKSHDIYSQWHKSIFYVDDQKFNCAEQFMMYKKAVLFGDEDIANEILHCKDPRKIKALGRQVRGFKPDEWQRKCLYIVKEGNKAKFTQKDDYLADMLFTYPKILVEASPYDNIWGIGLDEDSPDAWDESTWQGTNYLGYVLTQVRDDIMVERGMIDEEDRVRYIDILLAGAECHIDASKTESRQRGHERERKLELEGDRHDGEENTENRDTKEEAYFLFSHGIFSQFYEAYFEIDDKGFNCAEQYMMYKKAELFEDYEIAEEILKSTNPGKIKQLGRKVKGFDDKKWQQHCLHFVKEGNIAKFSQSERLEKAIVTTYPKVIVEANPYDKIWGIGLEKKDRRAQNKLTWHGKNFLGYVLTEVRDELMCQWGLIKEEKKSTYIEKLKEDWGTSVNDGSQEESMISKQSGNHSYDNSKEHNRMVTGDKHRENAQRNKGKHGAKEKTPHGVYRQAQGGGHRAHGENHHAHDDDHRTYDLSHQKHGHERKTHGDEHQKHGSYHNAFSHDQKTQSNEEGDKKRPQGNRKRSSVSDESVVPNVESGDWEHVAKKKHGKKGKNVENVPETDKTRQESATHNERGNKHTDTRERSGHAAKPGKKPDTKKVIVDDFDINVMMDILSEKDHEKMPPSSPEKSKPNGKRVQQHESSAEVVPKVDTIVSNVESEELEHDEKKKRGKKGKKVQTVPETDKTRQGSATQNDRDNKHTGTSERSGHAAKTDRKPDTKKVIVKESDINVVMGGLSEKDHEKMPPSSPAKSQPKGKGVQQHDASAEVVSKADTGNTSRRKKKNLKKKKT